MTLPPIDRLRELLSKATLGTWILGGPRPSVSVIVLMDPGNNGPDPEPPTYEPVLWADQRTEGEQDPTSLANAHLAIEAHETLPRLLAAFDALRAECEASRTYHEDGPAAHIIAKARTTSDLALKELTNNEGEANE